MAVDFLRTALKTKIAINDAIALLEIRKTNFADASESNWIRLEIAELELKYAKIEREVQLFIADTTKINPPTEEDFNIIEENVKAIDNMVANAVTSKAIIDTVTNIINAYDRSQA